MSSRRRLYLLAPSLADLSRVLICLLLFSNADRASNLPASLPNPAPEASTTANQDRAERETAPSIPDEDLDRHFTDKIAKKRLREQSRKVDDEAGVEEEN